MRSDLSVLHRIDDWTLLPARRFIALTLRLRHYAGSVATSMAAELVDVAEPVQELAAAPQQSTSEQPATGGRVPTLSELDAINHTVEGGPTLGYSVGLFDIARR